MKQKKLNYKLYHDIYSDLTNSKLQMTIDSAMHPDRQIFTDSHAKSILTTMNQLRKNNTLCDVTLCVEKQEFPAHRIVLAACSDYFCAMFTRGVSDSLTCDECCDLFINKPLCMTW